MTYKIKKFFGVCFLGYCFFSISFAHAACKVSDDIGQILHLKKPAQRIISLAPDITEIVFAIGAGSQLVGVVRGSDYPQAAQKINSVGSYSGIDLEKIIALRPDLIVTWGNTFSRQLGLLKTLGIPIYTTLPRRLEDIPRTMKNLGCLTGKEMRANQAAESYMYQLTALYERFHNQKELSVFYQLGSYSLLTINKESWIHQVIRLCGGRNVFANAKTITPEIGWEAVLQSNPDVIITDSTRADWKKRWFVWEQMTAVKEGFLFAVPPDLIDRASPRLLEGARQICEYLQAARERLEKPQ
jgi:iron complex transport system substrate-binding protein